MSTAHRPTWDPAQAKDSKAGSRQFSVRDMAAHTKLKFRQVGQTSTSEVQKRDLRAELLLAEQESKNKKRKAQGLPPLPIEGAGSSGAENEEVNKRRKLLQEALELDKDDDDDEDSDEEAEGGEGSKKNGVPNGKAKATGDADGDEEMGSPPSESGKPAKVDSDDDDSDEDEDDDEDTAELLRELEKIKRERAEEKERLEREQSASDAATREAEIASANPLMNLAAALGQPTGVNTTVPGSFAVKKRWDDDLIFKNQAMATRDKNDPGFVNDLLRTEFHKKFMAKFIK
jgi:protein CWC15